MSKNLIINLILWISLLAACANCFAQTSDFVYQGKLNDGATAANGSYQFEFRLYDAETGGNQVGNTISNLPATVTNGIFSVNLDFGANAFDGAARFLEISVRLYNGGQAYVTLNPRQPVKSTPYAVKSLKANEAATATTATNSLNLGGVPAANYTQTNDARLSDARTPTPFSTYYVQNGTNPQAASNFNISGEGKANIFSAAAQFNLGGNRVLHQTGTDNVFVGKEAGNSITSGGNYNAFFGSQSGKKNTSGFNNTFAGAYAGNGNITGTNNAFFGANSGLGNQSGNFNSFFGSNSGFTSAFGMDNSFFGASSGQENISGSGNSFFGRSAGKSVEVAGNNSFFGAFAGENTTTGGNAYFGAFAGQKNNAGFGNVFVGLNAGKENTGGSSNTFVGANSGQNQGAVGSNNTTLGAGAKVGLNVSNAVAIGANAFADASNKVVLGTDVSQVSVPGTLAVSGNLQFGGNATVSGNLTVNSDFNVGNRIVVNDSNADVQISSIKSGAIDSSGNVKASQLLAINAALTFSAGGGIDSVCIQPSSGITPQFPFRYLAHCSSSIRYKDNVQDYRGGLDVVNRLRPVTFVWKSSGKLDVGFIAEEVNKIEPLLNNYNLEGEVEGVKYAQVTTALVNAVKEQQTQIEKQTEQIRQQQTQIELLKTLICQSNSNAAVCQK